MAICIKVNSSGSWANLVPVVATNRIEAAKAACEALALASVGDITFKIVQDGELVAQLHKVPRAGEPHGWYQPSVIVSNAVQAGVDRDASELNKGGASAGPLMLED